MNKLKPILLIGGMGPQASAEALARLVDKSSLLIKQGTLKDHPEILVLSLPVPNFISDQGSIEAAFTMISGELKKALVFEPAATMIVCNTAHILFDRLNDSFPEAHLHSLINAVVEKAGLIKAKKVSLLATPTTVKTKLYQNALEQAGIEVALPSRDELKLLEKLIRQTIDGQPDNGRKKRLKKLVDEKLQTDCDAVLLGCTELPLIYGRRKDADVIDSLDILCDKVLKEYIMDTEDEQTSNPNRT